MALSLAVLLLGGLIPNAATAGGTTVQRSTNAHTHDGATTSTVWLCRPGLNDDPCTSSLKTTIVNASGKTSTANAKSASNSPFDCFYVYPTVSRELATNADLRIQTTEIAVAIAQASRFSPFCRIFAPVYRQVTVADLASYPNLNVPSSASQIAKNSLFAGFEDYLAHYNDGRPIVFIGHSQGAALLITLLAHMVDNDVTLRNRLVLAILLGGDVEVRSGTLIGGSFAHIPACSRPGETGCVIAYSSFPEMPPASSLFGRTGQGVALQSDQTRHNDLQVLCVNPAAEGGGKADLKPYFPSEGAVSTPWIAFPGLYTARCETAGGATWLEVQKATNSSDTRPVVTEGEGPDWGFHAEDVNLALGNLVADVTAAESSWTKGHPVTK